MSPGGESVSRAGVGGLSSRSRTAQPARPAVRPTTSSPPTHISLARRRAAGVAPTAAENPVAAKVLPGESSSRASFSSIRASAMSRSRSPFPFRRHRRRSARTVAGVPSGSTPQHLIDLGDEAGPGGRRASAGWLGGGLRHPGSVAPSCAPGSVGILTVEDRAVLAGVGDVVARAGQPLECLSWVRRDEIEARSLRERPPADNSPLAPWWTPLRRRLSGDVGHGRLWLWGRARDSVLPSDVIQDALDQRGLLPPGQDLQSPLPDDERLSRPAFKLDR